MENINKIKIRQELNDAPPELITMGAADKVADIDKSAHNILYLKEVGGIPTERKQHPFNLISRESTKYHSLILYYTSLSFNVFYVFLGVNKSSLPFNLNYKGGNYYG